MIIVSKHEQASNYTVQIEQWVYVRIRGHAAFSAKTAEKPASPQPCLTLNIVTCKYGMRPITVYRIEKSTDLFETLLSNSSNYGVIDIAKLRNPRKN